MPPPPPPDSEPNADVRSLTRNPVRARSTTGSALERVVDRFGALLRHTARARGLDEADVDELLQDVRVRLWRTQQPDETLDRLNASYIKKVALSAAVDMVRRRQARREESLQAVDAAHETPAALQAAADDPIARGELARRFEVALASLARNRRIVVQLHLEGYDRQELVKLTGFTEGKVRNLLYRGMEELRFSLRSTAEVAHD